MPEKSSTLFLCQAQVTRVVNITDKQGCAQQRGQISVNFQIWIRY